MPAAAQLACGPVVAGISGTVSLVAVPANLLAVPAIAPATVLGVARGGAVAGLAGRRRVRRLAGELAGLVAGGGGPATARGCRPGPCPGPAGCPAALLLAGLDRGAAARPSGDRWSAGSSRSCAVAVVLGALPVRLLAAGWPPPGWVVVGLRRRAGRRARAAGRAPGGRWWSTPARTRPAVDGCLRRLGVREVPLLVVSHFHADHVGGVAGVFRGRRVAARADPAVAEPAGGAGPGRGGRRGRRGRSAPAAAGLALAGRRRGRWSCSGRRTRCGGTRSDPNNNSLVLRATVAGVRHAAARRRRDRGAAGTAGPAAAAGAPRRRAEGRPPRLGVPGPGVPRRGPARRWRWCRSGPTTTTATPIRCCSPGCPRRGAGAADRRRGHAGSGPARLAVVPGHRPGRDVPAAPAGGDGRPATGWRVSGRRSPVAVRRRRDQSVVR